MLFQQASWIQSQFLGAWKVSISYWERFLGLSAKAARRGLRKLEEIGWISITQASGYDRSWLIEVAVAKATREIRDAEDTLEVATLWEVSGERKSSNNRSRPEGNMHGDLGETSKSTRGKQPPYSETEKHKKARESVPFEEDPPEDLTLSAIESVPERRSATRSDPRPQSVVEASERLSRSRGGLGQLLSEVYPHPANGTDVRRRPSAQAIEQWILELSRRGKINAAQFPVVLLRAEQEAKIAKRNPEAFRSKLRNWLNNLEWESEVESVKPETRARVEAYDSPKTDAEVWAEAEKRGRPNA